MKTCVIANPNAGSAADLGGFAASLLRLKHYTLRLTDAPGDAAAFAREALHDGYDRVVAAGGDGTLNGVVNGLAEGFASIELGLIPLGTGNDFARSIGVPADPAAAIDLLLAGQTRMLDVAWASNGQSRFFVNVSGAGFTAEVGEAVSGAATRRWGAIAHVWGAAKSLPNLTEYEASLVLDDRERIELTAYNILVANARFIGGGIPVAPQAILDDGRLDIIIVPAMPASTLVGVVPQILGGTHCECPDIIVRRASKVHVACKPNIPFNLDGELMGEGPVTFEVRPRALKVVVGPAGETEGQPHDLGT
jgi:diacylglycerol kinase (ATP)